MSRLEFIAGNTRMSVIAKEFHNHFPARDAVGVNDMRFKAVDCDQDLPGLDDFFRHDFDIKSADLLVNAEPEIHRPFRNNPTIGNVNCRLYQTSHARLVISAKSGSAVGCHNGAALFSFQIIS